MTTYGVTPAGFALKPLQAILGELEADQLATMDPSIDLSPTAPQGQLNGIMANAFAQLWELAGVCFNANNRQATEGQGLDNIGDLVGILRETATYTQVELSLTFSGAGGPYAPGDLVANVDGNVALAFSNTDTVTIPGAGTYTALFQALAIGATPSINPGTVTQITNPVAGWTSVTNPGSQSQLGANAELDANYAARQEQELGAEGSCNPSATIAAILELAAEQNPPVALTATAYENTTYLPITLGSLTLPPHTYAIALYDPASPPFTTTAEQQIGQIIWNNKPAGIQSVGSIDVTIEDPYLGTQQVYYSTAIPEPLFISLTVAIRPGFDFAQVSAAIQGALITASTAPTPADGVPPNGQLAAGADVIGSQLKAVVSSVPGVYDIQDMTFGFAAHPTNRAPLPVDSLHIATLTQANIGNIVVTQGALP